MNNLDFFLMSLKIPFEKEYLFAKQLKRKWRSDYYIEKNDVKLAIEIEGGVFNRGRHTRPIGFIKDIEKYNTYSMLDIKLLRFTHQQLNKNICACMNQISTCLKIKIL